MIDRKTQICMNQVQKNFKRVKQIDKHVNALRTQKKKTNKTRFSNMTEK